MHLKSYLLNTFTDIQCIDKNIWCNWRIHSWILFYYLDRIGMRIQRITFWGRLIGTFSRLLKTWICYKILQIQYLKAHSIPLKTQTVYETRFLPDLEHWVTTFRKGSLAVLFQTRAHWMWGSLSSIIRRISWQSWIFTNVNVVSYHTSSVWSHMTR